MRKRVLFAIQAILLLGLSSLVFTAPSVNAESTANPFCWNQYEEVNCTEEADTITAGTGSPPQAGKCYGFGYGIVEVDYDSDDCVEARAEIAELAGTPARCYRLNDTINDYWAADFEVENISEVDCETLRAIFTDGHGAGFEFTSGACYVVAQGDETSSGPCSTHDAYVWTAAQNPGDHQGPPTQPGAAQNAPITCNEDTLTESNCPAVGYLITAINIATASVVVIIVGSIIFAGIQYSSARDDPQAIGKAKHRILMAVIALIIFIFGYGILQWLVPGGILN